MRVSTHNARRLLPLAIAFVAGGGLSPGSVAVASDLDSAPTSMRVGLTPVDFSTPDRVAALYARIRNAARSVCGYADSEFPEERAAWDKCVDEAIGHAVARVGNAKLTNYYLARTGQGHVTSVTAISSVVDRVR